MNKRLEILEKMVKSGSGDSFAQYALALEYRKENRVDDAIATFCALRERDANYLPMYLMAGQIYVTASRLAEARDWLTAGISLAKAKGDHKALGELEAELSHANSMNDGSN
jgi:predicted Zn-dependent protease